MQLGTDFLQLGRFLLKKMSVKVIIQLKAFFASERIDNYDGRK